MSWVPLHVHSQYSILDASAPILSIANRAAEFGMPAAALTDHGNMYAAVDFYKACKAVKVKPILGCECYIAPNSRFEKVRVPGGKVATHLTLLAKDAEGYRNLCKLSSKGFLEGFYHYPRIDHDLLKEHSKGLICLSGCLSGRIAQAVINGSRDDVLKEVRWHQDLFGEDFYLELQRHRMTDADMQTDGMLHESWLYQNYLDYIDKQEKVNALLIEMGKELGVKCVATNDSHYMEKDDWFPHEILLNIQSGEPCEIWEKDSLGNNKTRIPNPKRRTYESHEHYFKSPQQMQALFSDIPEAITNTLEVADKCNVQLDFQTKHYPVFIPPALEGKPFVEDEHAAAVEAYLRALCEEGIPRRYTPERLAKIKEHYPDKEPMDVVRARLEYEISIIVPKRLADYLLIVFDFINWAKKSGIPMGPGRGSGAGSIVLYLIGVTDIEPLRFHLFFERFINPERISDPDIDVDICMDRRGEVIDYTLHKYGRENIAQIITFGTIKAKTAIRDVGRVLSVPLHQVNGIVKFVPEDLNMTLEKALETDPDLYSLYQNDRDAKRIIDIGKKLEGSIRSTGTHAAGIVISNRPLMEDIPLCRAKDSELVATQYSMKPVESVGMLKIDFLGLKTLTCIKKAVDVLIISTGKVLDWINLPLDDKPTFSLLNQGKTVGVFQMESTGMQDLARQLHLDKFEEIIAVGSLYRPGPMDMIPSFISRKHGREPIEYDHPWLKDILSETYGIMVYQEQVMQISNKLASFSLGEGDVLRKAMGKKEKSLMAKLREQFREGALKNGIDEQTSMIIFDKMEKFASYGFNKSHAAAYGYLTYVTAYLKANYPKEWMAALMTCDNDDLTKVAKMIRDCQTMDIAILPPDVNESGDQFTAVPSGIRFAMTAIRGMGHGVVELIVKERAANGLYTGLYDFLKRIDSKKIGKKQVESLVEAGCFDFTKWSRDALMASIDPMFDVASRDQLEKNSRVMTFFSLLNEGEQTPFAEPPIIAQAMPLKQLLIREKELLGFFLTGHPMDDYREILKRLSCLPFSDIETLDHGTVFRAAFIVESVQVRLSAKTQKKFAILVVSDGMESRELPIWSDLYDEKGHLFSENQLLYAVLQVDKKEENTRLSCRWVDDLTQVNEQMIGDCDRAYDRTKFQQARMLLAKDRPVKNATATTPVSNGSAAPAPVKSVGPAKLVLKMNAPDTRLSHILQIKELLRANPGPSPVTVDFELEGASVASLSIVQPWGVQLNSTLSSGLKNIPSVLVVGEE